MVSQTEIKCWFDADIGVYVGKPRQMYKKIDQIESEW